MFFCQPYRKLPASLSLSSDKFLQAFVSANRSWVDLFLTNICLQRQRTGGSFEGADKNHNPPIDEYCKCIISMYY